MSVTQTTPPPTPTPSRSSLARWVAGGSLGAIALTVVAIAVWPASAADQARDDGERVGEAVVALYKADGSAEVDAALADMDAAVTDARVHAGDEVADQAADQQDALARAAEGAAGSWTADDAWEQDVYQAELDAALDDLSSQASDFRAQGPEVHRAFWEGVDDGLAS